MYKTEKFAALKFAALAIFGALAIHPAYAEEKSAALVNGISIPQARLEFRVKAATAQGQADTPELRKAIREDMINLEVLAQEAANLGKNEYNARHILVETEAEAKAIIAQLGKKGNFDKIAKEKSKDAGSAGRGGSLNWAVPSNFVAPFANALTTLKKGAYTKEPVQTQFGWHVIKLDDVRELNAPPFDDVKPQIHQRLTQQSIQGIINDLRSKAKIE